MGGKAGAKVRFLSDIHKYQSFFSFYLRESFGNVGGWRCPNFVFAILFLCLCSHSSSNAISVLFVFAILFFVSLQPLFIQCNFRIVCVCHSFFVSLQRFRNMVIMGRF